MGFAPGVRLGAYEIVGLLGAGGMGEVYRARDTKLGREVAIKVLPEAFAHDTERLARFEREARTLASLNHPHIAIIHGLQDADGTRALVMELVEGPTLADRIAQGPIPIDEALPIAKQIAEALEAAHEHGIIHRDLKPANVKVRPDGTVKVLDFGLAKTLSGEGSGPVSASFSMSPTLTSPAAVTGMGVILGTAAYMSPEQARGKAVDKQADIWAFGCVLYEMLTGRQVFTGETMTDILGRIVAVDVDLGVLPGTTPPMIRALLRRCFQKDRRQRLHDIADARIDIESVLSGAGDTADAIDVRVPRRAARVAWALVAILMIGFSMVTGLYISRAPAEVPVMRLEIATPPGTGAFAISPDGRKLVFSAQGQLWLRPLESETAQPLAGTALTASGSPFWAPDSQSVGFFTAGQLKRIDLAGGLVRTLAAAPISNGGTWNGEGIILFARSSTGPLYRVRAGGGDVTEATRVEPPEQAGHRYPQFLPDGRHFLFFALGTPDRRGVYLGSLDSAETRRLFDADSAAVFAPPDYVLFERQGALVAQRLDLTTLEPAGDPLPVAGRLVKHVGYFSVALSAAAAGPVTYRASGEERQLVWLDRSGRQVTTVGAPDADQPDSVRLSPDGHRVALRRRNGGNEDVWLIEAGREILQRLTFDPAPENEPVWSPDGSRIVFASLRNGLPDLYEKIVGGAGPETLLFASSEFKNVYDWSPDGRFILYSSQTPEAGRDLWALPLSGDRMPVAVVQTGFEESFGRFSPDSRWLAYESNETGRSEVYVQPFPGPGGKSRMSTGGGTAPRWRGDGREVFYLGPDNRLMAVPVMFSGPTVDAGTPVALFSMPRQSGWDVSPDGQRFLVSTFIGDESPITVLLNWKPPAR